MKIEQIAKERGYRVTDKGILYNPKIKMIGFFKDGYHGTSIRIEGKSKRLQTHRLQAYQKYGNKLYNQGIVTRHKNSNSKDNSKRNILIGTHSQNMMDQPKEQRLKKALKATSFVRKYDKETVKTFYNKVKSYKKTMQEFNISSKGTLHFILNK